MLASYELKDIGCFVQIARAGSLSRAAALYDVPKATLSHHLRRLEDALKVELFVRHGRGLELTDAGREFLGNCSAIFDSCEAAANAAQRAHSTLGGKIRVVASIEFGTSIVGASAHYFAEMFPEIDFEIRMFPNDKILASQFDFDCMIFVGEPPDSSLLCRKMGDVRYGLYASPSFAQNNKLPLHPADLVGAPGVVYLRNGMPEKWALTSERATHYIEPYAKFSVNEYWMAKYFTVEGAVIGYLPDFFVKYEVELGALVPLLPEWQSEVIPAYVMYPAQRHHNPRVMMLVDALCKHFDQFTRYPGYSLIKTSHGGLQGEALGHCAAQPSQRRAKAAMAGQTL